MSSSSLLDSVPSQAGLRARPVRYPERPWFSSGPTAKRPGWSLDALSSARLGRSNRSTSTVGRLNEALDLTRDILQVPDDYAVTFVPGSDTGAFEAALWNLLGPRPVQVLSFENFSQLWATDTRDHLGINPEILSAPYGALPDLGQINPEADLVFAWNGTTAGVKVPNGDFIAADRGGLTLCDATSATFSMDLPWDKLDVVTFSFQKALGGEAGIGALILSPRAVARLDSHTPSWPIPKVLRLKKGDKADRAILAGDAINTYSFLVIEDYIDALRWAGRIGGLDALIGRTEANAAVLEDWIERTPWIDYLAVDPATRSTTSVCLTFTDPIVTARSAEDQAAFVKAFCTLLEREQAAFDISGYRAAPPGLRIWCGCTVDAEDLRALTPWLEWAWSQMLLDQPVTPSDL